MSDRRLTFTDQFALWGSMAVTLTIPAAAAFVINPLGDKPIGFAAASVAIVAGTLVGSVLLGAIALLGRRAGRPTMAMFGGILGQRTSWIPTVLNILQCIGWAAVEVLVITDGTTAITSPSLRPLWALVGGVLMLAMAIWPVSAIKAVRKYLVALVILATLVLVVGLLQHGIHATDTGSWHGFWPAFDIVISLPVSWAPLVADYSRHSRDERGAFLGTAAGFATGGIVYFFMGLLAFLTITGADATSTVTQFIPALIAVKLGMIALVILIIDELDKGFANIHSTAVSIGNLSDRLPFVPVAVGVAAIATAAALLTDLTSYESFLYVIGAVFVPLTGVAVTWVFGVHRGRYDADAATAWLLVPWLAGLSAYQLLAPGYAPGWSDAWNAARSALGITTVTWSASIVSLIVAVAGTWIVAVVLGAGRDGRGGRRGAVRDAVAARG